MNDYFGYARVSTNKQGEGVSLEAQKEAIEAYADSNGLTISDWFEEKETAAKQGRPIFNAMVKALRQKRMRGLIVHKIDRSARNFRDWARIGDLADEGFDIRFATETLDFQTRGGRLSADIQAVIAADYVRNLKEEIRKGVDGCLKLGLFPFGAPIGYLNNGKGKPKTLDPERASLVKEMFALYATGRYSLRSLREEMTRRGFTNREGNPPTKKLIEKALSNPFYCGVIRIRTTGATYQGIHEPLIDTSTYQRVQDIKSGKSGKKITRHDHLYRGLFACGHCKRSMIPERQKGRVYYRCQTKSCATTTIREDRIEAEVQAALLRLELTQEARERLVSAVSGWVEERIAAQNTDVPDETGLVDIESKLERLTDALIDHLIDKDIYNARRESLLLQKAELEKAQQRTQDLQDAPTNVRKFLELAKNLTWLYQTLTRAERRRFVYTVTSNRLVFGKTLQLEPSEWLQVIPQATAAPFGAPTRPNSRTRHESDCNIIGSLVKASTCEDLALLKGIIDQSASGLKEKTQREKSEPNKRSGKKFEVSPEVRGIKIVKEGNVHRVKEGKPGVPQWKYNLKNQWPDDRKPKN